MTKTRVGKDIIVRHVEFRKACMAIPEFAKRLAPVYAALDWKWMNNNTPPAELDIQACLFNLLYDVAVEGNRYAGTGGLMICRGDPEDSLDTSLHITFTLGETIRDEGEDE